MKEVDIISKVVGRDTSGKAAMYIPGAGAPSVNLDDYLLKKIWDSVFEIRTDGEGNPYLFEKMPFVTQYGITMYADVGELDLPSIYAGIPFDNKTIWLNPETKKVEVIGGTGGGVADSVHWNNIEGKPSFASVATSGKYADLSGLPDLSVYATTEYLTAELKKYVTLNTEQTIAARKNFLNGLSVGGLGITKSQDDVVYIDANLVVRGGITMYAEGEVDIPSILDSLPIASTTAKGIASFDSSYFSVDSDGKVTLLAENVGLNETELFDYLSRNNYAKKSDIPSLSGYATETYVEDRLDDLINGAPAAYDTLKEIADVLAGNVDSIGDIITTLGTKADKAIKISAGTGLSGGGTLEADRTLSLATSGVTAGTYKSVVVDRYGRVTSGTNPTTLAGYGITDAYTKTKVDELLSLYVTLAGAQTITGEKNFTGGLKVNGSPIVYDATNKYWKLEGDLLVTGGVTMFASDSAFTPSTIMDAIATDGTNLKVVNGVLTFVGSIDGGEAGSVAWENVTDKPSFASVATSGKYSDLSGTPTLLSSFTNDQGFASTLGELSNVGSWADLAPTQGRLLYQEAGSSEWSYKNISEFISQTGAYLPLSGGDLHGQLRLNYNNDNPIMIVQKYSSVYTEFISALNSSLNTGQYYSIGFGYDSSNYNRSVLSYWHSGVGSNSNRLTLGLHGVDNVLNVVGTGNVGIGTTSPLEKLDVAGSIRCFGYGSNLCVSTNGTNTSASLNMEYSSSDLWQLSARFTKDYEPENNKINLFYYNGTTWFKTLEITTLGDMAVEGTSISRDFYGKIPSGGTYHQFRIVPDEISNAIWIQASNYTGTSRNGNLYLSGMQAEPLTLCKVHGPLLVTDGITMYSDIRKKTKLQDVELSLQQIADAPLIEHYYNSDSNKTTHVGSIAQYWAGLNDWFCKEDSEGFYTMEIQNAALASAISIARELVKYESKTDKEIRLLKDEVKRLKKEIKILKSA